MSRSRVWTRGATVSDALTDFNSTVADLDDRLTELEDEVGSSFAFEDLGSRVDQLEGRLDDACAEARSASLQSIGTDAFYAFLALQRALC